MKWTDPDAVRADVESTEMLVPTGALVLDIAAMSPGDAAAAVQNMSRRGSSV